MTRLDDADMEMAPRSLSVDWMESLRRAVDRGEHERVLEEVLDCYGLGFSGSRKTNPGRS